MNLIWVLHLYFYGNYFFVAFVFIGKRGRSSSYMSAFWSKTSWSPLPSRILHEYFSFFVVSFLVCCFCIHRSRRQILVLQEWVLVLSLLVTFFFTNLIWVLHLHFCGNPFSFDFFFCYSKERQILVLHKCVSFLRLLFTVFIKSILSPFFSSPFLS